MAGAVRLGRTGTIQMQKEVSIELERGGWVSEQLQWHLAICLHHSACWVGSVTD